MKTNFEKNWNDIYENFFEKYTIDVLLYEKQKDQRNENLFILIE